MSDPLAAAAQLFDSQTLPAWLLIFSLTASIAWVLIRHRQPAGPFSLLALFCIFLLMGFTFRGIDLASGGNHHLRRAYDITSPGFIGVMTFSLLLAQVGFIAFVLAYRFGPSRPRFAAQLELASSRLFFDSRAFWTVIGVFSVIGAVGLFWVVVRPLSDFFPHVLLNFGAIAGVLLAIRWFISPAQRKQTFLVWSVILILAGGYGVFIGMKVMFVTLLLPIILGIHYYRRRLGWGHLLLAMAIFAATFPFFYSVRNVGFFSPKLSDQLSYYYNISRVAAPFLGREYDLDATMLAVDYIGSGKGYFYGGTLEDLPTFFVPRAFWPDKPVSFGLVFNRKVAVEGSFQPTTFIAPSLIGELYLNAGLAAVIFGCLLVGMLLRFVERTLVPGTRPMPLALAIYSLLAIHMTQLVEGPIATHLEFTLIDLTTIGCAIALSAAVVKVTSPSSVLGTTLTAGQPGS